MEAKEGGRVRSRHRSGGQGAGGRTNGGERKEVNERWREGGGMGEVEEGGKKRERGCEREGERVWKQLVSTFDG